MRSSAPHLLPRDNGSNTSNNDNSSSSSSSSSSNGGVEVTVSSVDAYQGREADVVVFSAVRCAAFVAHYLACVMPSLDACCQGREAYAVALSVAGCLPDLGRTLCLWCVCCLCELSDAAMMIRSASMSWRTT